MKIDSYAIVYSGLNTEPYFADATAKSDYISAAAFGNQQGAAHTVIDYLETLSRNNNAANIEGLAASFDDLNTKMFSMGLTASAAGAVCSKETIQLFNVGNVRAFLFVNGYMTLHSDDHTEAYESYLSYGRQNAAEYDSIRFRKGRLNLKRMLGLSSTVQVQFYPPFPLVKDTALLICTDRFWHYLNVMEMELDYRKSAGPEEWLKIMARRVLMKANQDLDKENFAAVTAMVED